MTPLHALAHRLEEDGHDSGRRQREEEPMLPRQQRTDGTDDADVCADD
ncbi:MAG: hypothetical protein U0232_25595 [Thermomicrobiales bacterium]